MPDAPSIPPLRRTVLRTARALRARLVFLAPLLLTGCSDTETTFTILALSLAAGVLLFGLGFAVGVQFCCEAYAHWETVVGMEHRRDVLRLSEASIQIATDADAAIRACHAALRSLRRTATSQW